MVAGQKGPEGTRRNDGRPTRRERTRKKRVVTTQAELHEGYRRPDVRSRHHPPTLPIQIVAESARIGTGTAATAGAAASTRMHLTRAPKERNRKCRDQRRPDVQKCRQKIRLIAQRM